MIPLTFALGCAVAGYGCYRLDQAAGAAFRATAAGRAIDAWFDRTAARIRKGFAKRKGWGRG